MSQQPQWKLVANLGDVNVADYGGFLVYVDETGVYQPEVEMYWPNDEEETGGTMYRFVLEPPRFKTFLAGQWDTNKLAIASERGKSWCWYREWFVDKLSDVARYAGIPTFTMLRMLTSRNPVKRAMVYESLVGYFGPHEFDSYPVDLSEEAARERYAHIR